MIYLFVAARRAASRGVARPAASLSPLRFTRAFSALCAVLCALAAVMLLAPPQAARAQTSQWTPVDYSVGAGSGYKSGFLLWRRSDNLYAVWKISENGALEAGVYVSNPGYTCDQLRTNDSGYPVLLWKNAAARKIAVWRMASNLSSGTPLNARIFDYPASSYTPQSLAIISTSYAYVTWRLSNGTFVFWKINYTSATLTPTVSPVQTPLTGYKDGPITVDDGSRVIMALQNASGRVLLKVYSSSFIEQATYIFGPYTGVTFRGLSASVDDDLRLLWTYSNGKVALWRVDYLGTGGGTILASKVYGPYPGANGAAITTDSNNYVRLLWRYDNGKAAVWRISDTLGSLISGNFYGPL